MSKLITFFKPCAFAASINAPVPPAGSSRIRPDKSPIRFFTLRMT